MKAIFSILCLIVIYAFLPAEDFVLSQNDYDHLLLKDTNKHITKATEEYSFWERKLQTAPHQYPYKIKMAHAQNLLFGYTGNVDYLREATRLLEEAAENSNLKNASILRQLAKNYISEHRFVESKDMLLAAEILGADLASTEKMLFDAYMELGDYDLAKCYLDGIAADEYSFDVLIRKSKWADHSGELDHAIFLMERALHGAKEANNKDLIQWTITNLADYYGHAGMIEKSYNYYLKALEIDPTDAYAKKGIAWVAYSHDGNVEEANRILDAIQTYYKSPDHLLFRAEMAEFQYNEDQAAIYQEAFVKEVSQEGRYAAMYNAHLVSIYAENPKYRQAAYKLASGEVNSRPTAASYSLLALVFDRMGDIESALSIIDSHVRDRTYEPDPLQVMAEIYAKAERIDEIQEVKADLIASSYELGPVITREIKQY